MKRMCFMQHVLTKIQLWMISTFPSTAARWIHQQRNVLVEPIGDRLSASQCLPISTYYIVYNRTYENACYSYFLVKTSENNQVKFLHLPDRQLLSSAVKLNCNQ